MDFYSKLTVDQVHAVHGLLNFLERLRVTGHFDLRTLRKEEFYSIIKDGYNPDKTRIMQHELLEKIFGRLASASTLLMPE
jgi:hypothetical protein